MNIRGDNCARNREWREFARNVIDITISSLAQSSWLREMTVLRLKGKYSATRERRTLQHGGKFTVKSTAGSCAQPNNLAVICYPSNLYALFMF